MTIDELSLDDARRFIYQGLCLQKAVLPPRPAHLRVILEWVLEIASSGEPVPPVGFVADLGVTVFGLDRGENRPGQDALPLSEVAKNVFRQYEDFVLGKIYGDWTFERACDALRTDRYHTARDKARGLAFLIAKYQKNARFGGVLFSPSIVRGLLDVSPEETLARGKESLHQDGLMPLLEKCYRFMIGAARSTADMLQEPDYTAIERGVAAAVDGQRLAFDMMSKAAVDLRNRLPAHRVKPLAGRHEVPTRVLDEDTYPVGGFASISTRGSIESLLHSQLAYMEPSRPDLFDIKYLRDELYYYSRDENQFLRRRRTFVLVFYPDLVAARRKDPAQDSADDKQLIVSLFGLVQAGIQKVTHWLNADALRFDLVFLNEGRDLALQHEYEMCAIQFADQIENGLVELHAAKKVDGQDVGLTPADAAALCRARSRRSLVHCLNVSTVDRPAEIDDTVVTRLQIDGALPKLGYEDGEDVIEVGRWHEVLERLLQIWV
jgi:hypothetical protein